jgi:hypothetical protein
MATVSEVLDPARPRHVARPKRGLAQRVYLFGTWLMLVLIIVQFAAAGAGVFSVLRGNSAGASILLYHRGVGPILILVLTIVMVVAAFVGHLPWRMTGLAASFFPLLVLQSLLIIPYSYPKDIPALASMPWLSGLHVLNALFIFWLAFQWPMWTRRDLAIRAGIPQTSRTSQSTG